MCDLNVALLRAHHELHRVVPVDVRGRVAETNGGQELKVRAKLIGANLLVGGRDGQGVACLALGVVVGQHLGGIVEVELKVLHVGDVVLSHVQEIIDAAEISNTYTTLDHTEHGERKHRCR